MSFTKEKLKSIRTDIVAALAAVESKHGINLDMGNTRFDSNQFTTKISGSIEGGEEAIWVQSAPHEHRDKFGKTFVSNGKTFTITGWNNRARKMPVNANCPNGSSYKFRETVLDRAV